MVNSLIETFSEMEIYLLTLLINKVNDETIVNYSFEKEKVNELINSYKLDEDCINSLIFKNVIKSNVIKTCKTCDDYLDVCECEVEEVVVKEYFIINLEKFIECFVNTFAQYYGIEIEESKKLNEYQWTYNIIGRETELQINLRTFQEEFLKSIKIENKLIISVMPLNSSNDSYAVFEWNEVLDKDNIDRLKIKLQDLNKNFKNTDFYYLDIGDDCSIDDVENIRTILRKYLINNEYKNYTENRKYRPEYIEYNFPIDKIKECFILNDSKIFVFKPSEKEISIAYFKSGIIGDDEKVHDMLYKFDCFMKKRVERLRHLKFIEVKSDKMQRFIEICGPAINIFMVILSIFSKNNIFKNIISMFGDGKKWFLYIYIFINLISLITIIIYSIAPAFLRITFKWEHKLNKIK